MRSSGGTERAAVTAAALAQLDDYLNLLDELLRSPDDPSLYQRNSKAFDAMRGLTAALPQVRTFWVEVLISRLDLLNAVGWKGLPGDRGGQLVAVYQTHLQVIESFRRRCWHYVGNSPVRRPRVPPSAGLSDTPFEDAQRRVLAGERLVSQQRELVQALEARGRDASDARVVLTTLEKALEAMYFNLRVTTSLH